MNTQDQLAARSEALVQAEADVALADFRMLSKRDLGDVSTYTFSEKGVRGLMEGAIRRGFIEGVAFAVRETSLLESAIDAEGEA